MWQTEPQDVAASFHRIGSDRLVLGVGVGHKQIDQAYEKPYDTLVGYLDRLDVPADKLLLAALGPKVLKLAADRTAGAHPYLVPVEHTAAARRTARRQDPRARSHRGRGGRPGGGTGHRSRTAGVSTSR